MVIMSMALAAVLSVFIPPANNIVLDNKRGPPEAGCLMISVIDCPLIGLANALSVILPDNVIVCTLPLAALGVIVPVVPPPANTTSRASVYVSVVNTPVDATLDPIAPGLANVAPPKLLAFKLATLVVDATINGAVPVVTVLVTVVKRPVLAVVEPIAGGLTKLNVPPSVKLPVLVTVPVKVNPFTVPVPLTEVTVPPVAPVTAENTKLVPSHRK